MTSMLEEDICTNRSIGNYGAQDILQRANVTKVRILTHCNTGSLATAGWGTALGKYFWFNCFFIIKTYINTYT